MKHLLIITSIILLFVSCATKAPLSKSEYNRFTISGDSIKYDGKYVAKFLNLEWEYYRGKKTMEISVERINGSADEMTDKIVDFIRTKHPKAKAEVKIPHTFKID